MYNDGDGQVDVKMDDVGERGIVAREMSLRINEGINFIGCDVETCPQTF